MRSRRVFVPLLTAGLLMFLGGCDDATFHLELRIRLGVDPDHASSGGSLTFTLSNEGDVEITAEEDHFVFVVRNTLGDEVRRIDEASGRRMLDSGDELSAVWDQRDGGGNPVPAGDYEVSVRFRGDGGIEDRERSFTID